MLGSQTHCLDQSLVGVDSIGVLWSAWVRCLLMVGPKAVKLSGMEEVGTYRSHVTVVMELSPSREKAVQMQ